MNSGVFFVNLYEIYKKTSNPLKPNEIPNTVDGDIYDCNFIKYWCPCFVVPIWSLELKKQFLKLYY